MTVISKGDIPKPGGPKLVPKTINFKRLWSRLSLRIDCVMNAKVCDPPISRMEMFEDVYKACVSLPPHAADLYKEIDMYLEKHVKEICNNLKTSDKKMDLLVEYENHWSTYRAGAGILSQVFNYLNMNWITQQHQKAKNDVLAKYTYHPQNENENSIKNKDNNNKGGGGVPCNIEVLCLRKWQLHLFQEYESELLSEILLQIERDRKAELVDANVLHSVIHSFVEMGITNLGNHQSSNSIVNNSASAAAAVDLGLLDDSDTNTFYHRHFEASYLEATRDFYKSIDMAEQYESDFSSCMKHVLKYIDEEETRARKMLPTVSHLSVLKVVELQLIGLHKEKYKMQFEQYLQSVDLENLRTCFVLIQKVPNGIEELLCAIFQKHLTDLGTREIVALFSPTEASIENDFMKVLLQLREKYSNLCHQVFSNDTRFFAALDRAFEKILNCNYQSIIAENKSRSSNSNDNNNNNTKRKSGKASSTKRDTTKQAPQLIAKYCDYLLKKSSKHSIDNIEHHLTLVITIFKYLEDKDIFQKFYSKLFAKRLIHNTSISTELESTMISLLKQACGYDYTSKLQRMYTDVGLCDDLNYQYKAFVNNIFSGQSNTMDTGDVRIDPSSIVDTTVLVLGQAAWPYGNNSSGSNSSSGTGNAGLDSLQFELPESLKNTISIFEEFYQQRHTGRKLKWQHSLSRCDLKLTYLSKRYELQGNNMQVGILLLFNNTDTLTLEEIEKRTKISGLHLDSILASLVKTKLIIESSKLENNKKSFQLNMKFSNKKTKFKLPSIAMNNSSKSGNAQKDPDDNDDNQTRESILRDRNLMVQACIVRIMKTRQVISHKDLMMEVISQTSHRFNAPVSLIKKCIGSLIDKEYIARKDASSDTYQYVS